MEQVQQTSGLGLRNYDGPAYTWILSYLSALDTQNVSYGELPSEEHLGEWEGYYGSGKPFIGQTNRETRKQDLLLEEELNSGQQSEGSVCVPVMCCVPMLLLGFLGCVRAPPERGVSMSPSCPGPHFLLHLTVTAEPLLCRVALTVSGPPSPHSHQPFYLMSFWL